jgi:hypothetical protein
MRGEGDVARPAGTGQHFEQPLLNGCFFGVPGLPRDLSRLKAGSSPPDTLADGFEPLLLDEFPTSLDPLSSSSRETHVHWEQT